MKSVATASTLAFALALGAVALADPDTASGANNIAGFDRIDTTHISFNFQTGNFTLPDRFTASSKGTDITADHATGNSKQKLMHATGHVVVHQKKTNGPGKGDFGQRSSTLTCDQLDVDGVRKVYVASGNMHFVQEGGREATSDTATLDEGAHLLHMVGHVHVRQVDETIDADKLDYDTQSGQVEGDGNVTITAPAQSPEPLPSHRPRRV